MQTSKKSIFVPLILILNIAVFVAWSMADRAQLAYMSENFLVSWTALEEGRYWTLLTSAFSHNMLLHIFLNMFVLLNFGRLLESVLGRRVFLVFYLLAGVVSSFAHAAVSAYILKEPSLPALGASGAIAGLILVFALVFPRAKILLFGVVPLPAIIGAAAFVGLDIWGLVAQAEGGGLPIGHGAHLGGALTGIFFYFFFIRRRLRGRTVSLDV